MPEALTLTDTDFKAIVDGQNPVLLLLTTAMSLRGDFSTAFKKAIAENNSDIVFAQIDAVKNPQAAEYFSVGSKPLLVPMYAGEVLTRRTRPWGSDVPLAIDLLNSVIPKKQPVNEEIENPIKEETSQMADTPEIIDGKPVNVTDDTFEELVLNSPIPVLVDYWAEWCGPCRMVAPILEKLAGEYAGKVRIAKVDTDANQGLAQHFKIMSIPTIMMIKDRTIVFSQPGALPEPAFRDLIEQLISLEIPKEGEGEEEADETQEKTPEA